MVSECNFAEHISSLNQAHKHEVSGFRSRVPSFVIFALFSVSCKVMLLQFYTFAQMVVFDDFFPDSFKRFLNRQWRHTSPGN